MYKIYENIAFAKAILNREGISRDTDEWKDYQKIRDICGNNHGYVGILTKLRFVDNVDDMLEIESIFNVLKDSKIDVNKLNRMSYEDILEKFYIDLVEDHTDDKDVELVFKDKQYTYYRVHTYEGHMKIGSPAWCLKTKKYWRAYQKSYPHQWVAIDNRWRKRVVAPDTNYMKTYDSKYGYIRYGISYNPDNDKCVMFTDTNQRAEMYSWGNSTSSVIYRTIYNLERGIKKSGEEHIEGCTFIKNKLFKVDDVVNVFKFIGIDGEIAGYLLDENTSIYLCSTYTWKDYLLIISKGICYLMVLTKNKEDLHAVNDYRIHEKIPTYSYIKEYAKKRDKKRAYDIYTGFDIINGDTTLEDVKSKKGFITQIDKWLVFEWSDKFYLAIDCEPKEFHMMNNSIHIGGNVNIKPSFYFFIKKNDMSVFSFSNDTTIPNYAKPVIQHLKNADSDKRQAERQAKRKSMLGSFKKFFTG